MRWYAASTISLALFAAGFGCSSDGRGNFIAPPEDDGAGGRTTVGGAGANHAGRAGADTALAGSGGDAGTAPDDGDGGAPEADAGAAGNADNGGSGGGGGVKATALPRAPSDLVLKVASATSVHLAWTDNADDETGYEVYWSEGATKPAQPNKQLAANATSGTADGLTKGKEYTFWVQAYNDVGSSTATTGKAIPLPVPAAPTGLTIAAGPTDAVLTWTDAAVGEDGYRIYFSTSSTQPAMAQYELPADASTYTLTGSDIDAYAKYYYWVVAYNSAGESIAATGTGTTGVLPSMPSNVSVDTSTSVWTVGVSWLDNSEHSSSFNIYWSTNGTKPAQPNDTAPGDSSTYKMKSVLANQTYSFWVESVNSLGTSAASEGTATKLTYEQPWTDLYYDPATNTIHQAIQDTFGFVTDNDATTGLYGYHTTSQALGAASSLNPAINWNPSSAGIDVSVTQSFWAESRIPTGSSFSVRTLTPPGALGAVSATPSQLSVALSWSAVSAAGGYQIYKGSSSDFSAATSYAVQGGTTLTVGNLTPGTGYNFWVRPLGVGINGTGLPGATVNKAVTTTGPVVGSNLALGKAAVASSAKTDATKVADGFVTTHWQAASAATTEWIYVNLGDGNETNITHVRLVWESSYATSFDIQVCPGTCDDNASVTVDNWAWVTAYSGNSATLSGFPNYQFVTLTTPSVGQFIRLKPKTLSGTSGVSLDEFEVYSAAP